MTFNKTDPYNTTASEIKADKRYCVSCALRMEYYELVNLHAELTVNTTRYVMHECPTCGMSVWYRAEENG